MGHFRARRLIRPRPSNDPTFEQLTEELAETRRRITQYAAIIAYQENEIRRLRELMCPGCKAKYEAIYGHGHGHERGDCLHVAGGSQTH